MVKQEVLREAQLTMLGILKEVDSICQENNIKYFISDGTLLGAVRHGGFIPWDDDLDISMFRKEFNRFLEIAPLKLKDKYFMQTPDTDPYYKRYHIPLKIRHKYSKLLENGYDYNEKFNQGIFIDIFPLDYMPENPVIEFAQHQIRRIYTKLLNIKAGILSNEKKYERVKKLISWNFIKFLLNVLKKTLTLYKKSEVISYGIETPWYGVKYKAQDILPLKKIQFEGMEFLGPNNPDGVLSSYYGDYMTLPPKNERLSHTSKIEIFDDNYLPYLPHERVI